MNIDSELSLLQDLDPSRTLQSQSSPQHQTDPLDKEESSKLMNEFALQNLDLNLICLILHFCEWKEICQSRTVCQHLHNATNKKSAWKFAKLIHNVKNSEASLICPKSIQFVQSAEFWRFSNDKPQYQSQFMNRCVQAMPLLKQLTIEDDVLCAYYLSNTTKFSYINHSPLLWTILLTKR